MHDQKPLILDKEWDVLLVLDACRYDYFERIYDDYLDGELKMAESPGTSTVTWLYNTFNGDWKDTIYVSGNPWINSSGEDTALTRPILSDEFKDVGERFSDVVDMWDSDLVPPDRISKAVRRTLMRNPDKKIIGHYMQPHAPYLEEGLIKTGRHKKKSGEGNPSYFQKMFKYIRDSAGMIMVKTIGWKWSVKVRRFLGIGTHSQVEEIKEKYSVDKLRELYMDNLRKALYSISELCNRLPLNVAVTSDHGEFLGEDGLYGHHSECERSILKRVPWLEVFN